MSKFFVVNSLPQRLTAHSEWRWPERKIPIRARRRIIMANQKVRLPNSSIDITTSTAHRSLIQARQKQFDIALDGKQLAEIHKVIISCRATLTLYCAAYPCWHSFSHVLDRRHILRPSTIQQPFPGAPIPLTVHANVSPRQFSAKEKIVEVYAYIRTESSGPSRIGDPSTASPITAGSQSPRNCIKDFFWA